MPMTGLLRRSPGHTLMYGELRAYCSEDLQPPETVIQDVLRVHNQRQKPSCVGQAFASVMESFIGTPQSSVDLWTIARVYQGDLNAPHVGTESAYAIRALQKRGVSPYIEGEDERSVEEDIRLPHLDQELHAFKERQDPAAEHLTLNGDRCAQACDALARGLGVTHGGAVNQRYVYLRRDEVVDDEHITGDNGHERRIFGYIKERGLFLELNSWGDWGGATLLRGFMIPKAFVYENIRVKAGPLESPLFMRGAAWLTPEAYRASWESDSLLVKTRET